MKRILLTCEHGGNRVPTGLKKLLSIPSSILNSHQGMDFGALAAARYLSKSLKAPLIANELTRLVVDFNRSPHHPQLFSKYSKQLSSKQKAAILKKYYEPYRQKIEQMILSWRKQGHTIVHLSMHSFTPVLKGQKRRGDLGWLYDPRRKSEKKFCRQWRKILQEHQTQLHLRSNYPYRGIADGLIPWLRKKHPENYYIGIELEINQRLWHTGGKIWQALLRDLGESLEMVM